MSDYQYHLGIVNGEKELELWSQLIVNKESLLRNRMSSFYQAENITKTTSIALVHHSLNINAITNKCIIFLYNQTDEPSLSYSLIGIANFILQQKALPTAKELFITIPDDDLFSFRVASFICDFWTGNNRTAYLSDFSNRKILPLYRPSVRTATSVVLFSILDFIQRYGREPTFEDLRIHNFKIMDSTGAAVNEGSYRKWANYDDRKYVSTLYASITTLEDLNLVNKTKGEPRGKIVGLRPTLNGLLTVLFSDMLTLIVQPLNVGV